MAVIPTSEYDQSYFEGQQSTYTHNGGYTAYGRYINQKTIGVFAPDVPIEESTGSLFGDMIKALKEARMIVVEGTLYPLLTRLKNAGLLAYRWEESTQGPPRKYYELTDNGRKFLGELETSWSELINAVAKIKSKN